VPILKLLPPDIIHVHSEVQEISRQGIYVLAKGASADQQASIREGLQRYLGEGFNSIHKYLEPMQLGHMTMAEKDKASLLGYNVISEIPHASAVYIMGHLRPAFGDISLVGEIMLFRTLYEVLKVAKEFAKQNYGGINIPIFPSLLCKFVTDFVSTLLRDRQIITYSTFLDGFSVTLSVEAPDALDRKIEFLLSTYGVVLRRDLLDLRDFYLDFYV
jgi:hypothetical protein